MQADAGAVFRSPRAALSGPTAGAATRHALAAGPICFTPRRLDATVAEALDALAPEALPRFDASGPSDRLRRAVTAAFPADPDRPILTWLRDDLLTLLGAYTAATGSRSVRLRLQVVTDDMCRAFHVDNVAYRLVTTYRGPGTQWLAPRSLVEAGPGEKIGPAAINTMERGTVAILRGGKGATPERPGLLHRSPPIVGTGAVRLFLAINETDA